MDHRSDPKADAEDVLNLTARREEFLETFFRKGAEFTEQLLQEVQRMRSEMDALSEENASLRLQMASDDAIRDLLAKIKELESEKTSLRESAQNVVDEYKDYEGRYEDMERELDQMANLYVASFQLHATLDASEVLSVIEQMLMQFVGAARFGIFVKREKGGKRVLEPIHAFHCDEIRGIQVVWNDGPIGEAASTQVNYIATPETAKEETSPIACIPMILGSEAIGVIVIYELLEQKKQFVDVDFELFKLLAQHSSSAIIGSGLLARAEGVMAGLAGFKSL